MASYHKKFVAIDLETTHLDQREGRIMEVGAAEFELIWEEQVHTHTKTKVYGVGVKFGKTFSSLVNPEIEPSETALMITGIKKEELKTAPLWNSVKPELKKFIGETALVGHNIGFDLGYLENQGLRFKNPALDSLELARTFLPLEPSHSLEALAERFAVLKNAPHRALADCENTAHVTAEIINTFLRYPLKVQKAVVETLEKSKTNFIHTLANLPHIQIPQRLGKPEFTPKIKAIDFDIQFVDKTIYCYPLAFREAEAMLSNLSQRRTDGIIGLSKKAFLSDFNASLINPALALCEKRRDLVNGQETLPDTLAKILAKIIIADGPKPNLDLSSIKWSPDEMMYLHYFTVDPILCQKHHCAFEKSLFKKYQKPRFASLETVFALARDWSLADHKFPLMIFDLSAIEDKFTESASTSWNLQKIRNLFSTLYAVMEETPSSVETLLNELDLFFGILHLVYLKRTGEYAENLVIDSIERGHDRFQKLFYPAEKLKNKLTQFAAALDGEKKSAAAELLPELETLQTRLTTLAVFLENFFLSPDEKKIYWLKFNSSWVDLTEQPRDLKPHWKNFAERFSSVTIIDTLLPLASQNYFKQRLGLNDYDQTNCAVKSAPSDIPVRISTKNLSLDQQVQLFRTLEGKTLLLLPNELTLTKIYQSLQNEQTEAFAYKFSGNVPILKKKIKNFSGDNLLILLTAHALAKHWQILPPLDNLVIFKLPFEARGSKPALLDLTEPGSFITSVLPRTVSILHRTITSFLASPGKQKKVLVLDPRVLTDYDQAFRKYFEEFPDFVISTD